MDSESRGEQLHATGDDSLSGLSSWLADGRVDSAAASRARQRWLERQAGEEATLAGVLVDFAERDQPVSIRTTAGHPVRGVVAAMGADFVAVCEHDIGDALIPHTAIATVRSAPGERAPVGGRSHALEIVLAEALVELAADRPLVLVHTTSDQFRGTLQRAGRDILAIMLDGPRHDVVHVATGAIDHVIVLGR